MAAVVIDHGRGVTGRLEHAIDDSANPTATGDNDLVLFIDGVRFAFHPLAVGMGNDLVVENEEQRRDQHGQGHDQQHEIGQGAVDDEIGERKGNQHEGEFAGLWKAEAEEPERLFA